MDGEKEEERGRVNFICINHVRKLCAIVVNVIGVPNVLDADQQHLTTKITKSKVKRREEWWKWCVPLKALRSSCCLDRVDTKVHERWNEKRSSVIDCKALWHHRWANKRVPPLKIIIIKSVSRTENAKYSGKNPNQLHNLHTPLIHYTDRARTHSNYQLIVKDNKTTITNHFFGTKSKRDILEMDSDDVCVCVCVMDTSKSSRDRDREIRGNLSCSLRPSRMQTLNQCIDGASWILSTLNVTIRLWHTFDQKKAPLRMVAVHLISAPPTVFSLFRDRAKFEWFSLINFCFYCLTESIRLVWLPTRLMSIFFYIFVYQIVIVHFRCLHRQTDNGPKQKRQKSE